MCLWSLGTHGIDQIAEAPADEGWGQKEE